MTPQELRASILLLAMQGKVTQQLSSDGDAKELMRHLHIDKKIIPAEPPFDIPENWAWIPVGYLGASTDTDSFCDGPFGSNLKTTHQISKPEVRIIQLSNIGEDGWKDKNVKYTSYKHLEEVIPRCEVFPGNLVIAKMMPAGRTIEVPELGTRITLGSDAMKFVPNPILNKQFLLFAMRSQAFLGQVYAEAHGITRVRTTLNGVKSYVLPIPPIAEQKRIVAKLEEILPLIDRYEAAWNKLEEFNKRFPGDMQKSILQLAIQGKLVEQRPEEGTGEELFQQIQAEKQALIKAGTLRKTKALPEITEDLQPADFPDSWKVCYIDDIAFVTKLAGFEYSSTIAENLTTTGIPLFKGKNVQNGKLVLKFESYIPEKVSDELPRSQILKRCLLTPYVGTIGNIAIFDGSFKAHLGSNVGKIELLNGEEQFVLEEYVLYYLRSDIGYRELTKFKKATAQESISIDAIRNVVIAIPPLAEQKRIVAKLEEILPLCDRLK